MKIALFSDTHFCPVPIQLPECDIAMFAGDCCNGGQKDEYEEFIRWFANQPVRHRVFVPGNHDICCERAADWAQKVAVDAGIHYLVDSGCEINGLKIHGTPYQPFFCDWAFNVRDNGELRERHYDKIPERLDFLITHCPAKGTRDKVPAGGYRAKAENVGSVALRARFNAMLRPPRFHVFGHIHEGYGRVTRGKVEYINASVCDRGYYPINPVIVLDLP